MRSWQWQEGGYSVLSCEEEEVAADGENHYCIMAVIYTPHVLIDICFYLWGLCCTLQEQSPAWAELDFVCGKKLNFCSEGGSDGNKKECYLFSQWA